MKINHIINETTTAGSVATVSTPLGATQTRGNPSIYGGKKVGNLLKGKKTSKPFANSLNEAAMKDLMSGDPNLIEANRAVFQSILDFYSRDAYSVPMKGM